MKRVILLSVVILLICLGFAFAEVPCKINYQGRLIKDNVPVDGTRTMKFSIYDSLQGGIELWTSGDVSVEVHNGLFRYVIGSDGGDLSSIDWTAGQALYLQVVIEGETLTPREELSAYPYAINSHLLEGETKNYFLNTSGDAQTKDGGLNIIGNVGIGTTGPGAKLHVIEDDEKVKMKMSSRDPTGGWISRTWEFHGEPDYLLIAGDYLSPRRGLAVDINGNVGIGTTSPGQKLTVKGTIESTTGGVKFPDGTLQTSAVRKYDSGWFAVAQVTTYTKAHGLGTVPDIVQVWYSNTPDGSGDVVLCGSAAFAGTHQIAVVDVDSTNIKIRAQSYMVHYFDAGGVQRYPTTGYAKIVALK